MPQPRQSAASDTLLAMILMRNAALVFLIVLSLSSAVRAEDAAPAATEQSWELERRLLAPCCWRETLDVHESPSATELRHEIRRRLAAGEGVGSIESDLIARHGVKLRATLPGSLGYVLFAAILLGGLGVAAFLLWRRRRQPAAPRPAPRDMRNELPEKERRRLEERLDEDLDSDMP